MANVIVIGTGNVGSELIRQLERAGHTVIARVSRKHGVIFQNGRHVVDTDREAPQDIFQQLTVVRGHADAVMLAIPSGGADMGKGELGYILKFVDEWNVPVITCAKGGLAYRFEELDPYRDTMLGYGATVGGGTDMLEVLRRRELNSTEVIIHAVINGTLNSVMSAMLADNLPFSGAIADAQALGFAEPGNEGLNIVNGEIRDMIMKATIIHNVALSNGRVLSPSDFRFTSVGQDNVGWLTSCNARRRYIVTFASTPNHDQIERNSPGSFYVQCDRWTITGGFHNVQAESVWYDWLRQIGGVNNGYLIRRKSGKDSGFSLIGPGAGPETTAAAMVRDLNRLLKLHK